MPFPIDPEDTTLDPRTRAHAALWRAMLVSPIWSAMVRPGNQIDVMVDGQIRSRIKGGRAPADYTAFDIDQSNATWSFSLNSEVVGITQSYVMGIETGVLEIVPLNRVWWVTMACLVAAGDDLGIGDIVRSVNPRPGTDRAMTNPKPGVTIRAGYTSVMSVDVELYIDKSVCMAAAGL